MLHILLCVSMNNEYDLFFLIDCVELYALSRYFDASSRSSELDPQVSSLPGTGKVAESELRLAQLQHQLPSNEPGALMGLVENIPGEDEEDNDTMVCKGLFKDMKFFLNREVSPKSWSVTWNIYNKIKQPVYV